MVEEIKKLRVAIDGLAQFTKELKPVNLKDVEIGQTTSGATIYGKDEQVNSKEIEKAVDSLYLGKAWLGKVLGELGAENPYGSGYKTVEDIVPTQDVSEPFVIFEDFNHIEKVDWLRSEIENLINTIYDLENLGFEFMEEENIDEHLMSRIYSCFIMAFKCLSEARFWLGFELQKLKENDVLSEKV